ncbi:hypothetical protein JM946_12605 [Steroidobacter sp. S1-65]|uniref:Uncharacterized protein n=1 Tax=Steroidobacter gossypii TaxID=2805490 RepID=A0ABS1WX95_9GAMM|nr:hypothetical protein [Steroidobacter gossypii]MBM0105599.1 hypothetical protein [Steroidobacter gossypii]
MNEVELIGALVAGLQSGGNAALIGLTVVVWRAGASLIHIGQQIGERLARLEKALQRYMQQEK